MKLKSLLIAGGITAGLLGSLAVAPAANAESDAARNASCQAIGGNYVVGNNASNDRCQVVSQTVGQPVATGEPTTSQIWSDLGDQYLSAAPVRVERGTPEYSNSTVYGDWAITKLETNSACSYAGKSKVQKCTQTTTATESRDVFTITTISTPLYDVYEVIQDRQSVTTGAQPTTVTTTTRTITYRFTNNAATIANQQSDVSVDADAAGDPIAIYEVGDVIQVKVGEDVVANGTDVDILEPVKSGTETAEPYVVSTVNCIINGAKQIVRDNSCPVAVEQS